MTHGTQSSLCSKVRDSESRAGSWALPGTESDEGGGIFEAQVSGFLTKEEHSLLGVCFLSDPFSDMGVGGLRGFLQSELSERVLSSLCKAGKESRGIPSVRESLVVEGPQKGLPEGL